jgi:RTX calcium-binding nonapeptide repeat (4 copies)
MTSILFRATFLVVLGICSVAATSRVAEAVSASEVAAVEASQRDALQEVVVKLEQLKVLLRTKQSLVNLQASSPLTAQTTEESKFVLGAATHFSHGQDLTLLDTAKSLGATAVRDGIGWADVERQKGVYTFGSKNVSYLDTITKPGIESFVVFQPLGNKLYNNGDTVVSAADITAFGNFIVAVLDEYDGVKRIEIGNEFNSTNEYFNRGEATGDGPAERAKYYANIIKGVYPIIKAKHPDVEVLGGATHSIPVGYIQFLKEFGALEYMDGIAFHPYRPEPEQVDAEVRYLREVVADSSLKLYATEFGTDLPLADVPDYMLKMVVLMADAGVDEAIWYQLKGVKNTALVDTKGIKRPASESFSFINKTLLPAGRPKRMPTERPVQVFSLGSNFHVMWGNAAAISFSGTNLEFYNSRGEKISQPKMITNVPLVIKGENFKYTLSGDEVLADSFYQFDLTNSKVGYWSYYGLGKNGSLESLTIAPGQHKKGVSWNPSLSTKRGYPFIVTDSTLRPANTTSVVERFTAKDNGVIDIVGTWKVQSESPDGVELEIKKNGTRLYQVVVTESKDVRLEGVSVVSGDRIDFIVGNRTNASNDSTTRGIQITSSKQKPPVIDPPPNATSSPTTKSLVGTKKDDILTGTSGVDTISGKQGNDRLNGEAGDDHIQGNVGKDVLSGGPGTDTLLGGSGSDVFYIGVETVATDIDTISDFSLSEGDTINIASLLSAEQQTLPANQVVVLRQKGEFYEITLKSGGAKAKKQVRARIQVTPELSTVPVASILAMFVLK